MRMLQPRRETDLALEPSDVHVSGELRRENLDHDRTVQPEVLGDEDAAHPAAELALDAVIGAEDALETV